MSSGMASWYGDADYGHLQDGVTVTTLSPHCMQDERGGVTVTTWSPHCHHIDCHHIDCHHIVTTLLPLSPHCHHTFTKLSPNCRPTVSTLSPHCHQTVTTLSPRCHQTVTTLSPHRLQNECGAPPLGIAAASTAWRPCSCWWRRAPT